MSIRLIIAFSNMLFSEGISRLLENEKGITVVKILDPGSRISAELWNSAKPDVVLVDFTTLYNGLTEFEGFGDDKKHPFILLDTNCGKENIISAVLKKRVSGVLPGHSDAKHLCKAIKAVAKGDIWIDKATVKNLLHGIKALNDNQAAALTPRERGVVGLIEKGLRNKEIAQKLHISEPTVKTHLYRIFRKLNIKTRSELITYAIKKSNMNYGPF